MKGLGDDALRQQLEAGAGAGQVLVVDALALLLLLGVRLDLVPNAFKLEKI